MEAVSYTNSPAGPRLHRDVDPRLSYPSYKSLDNFVNIGRLRSLDGYIRERIEAHIRRASDPLFLNLHRLETVSAYEPGVREIWLARTVPGTPYDYLDLDRTDLWQRTDAASEFGELMSFIDTLPFSSTGRMLIIYDDGGREVPAHQDHQEPEVCYEFIWFRTNLGKPFYVLDQISGRKEYVDSYTAWFDTVNQFHGSDAVDRLTFSIRVDGVFTDEFRRQIPLPQFNRASTPSLWASVAGAEMMNGGTR